MKKKSMVLFVGSFLQVDKNGGVGGQMYACNSLISSDLSDNIEWVKLDTTAISNLRVRFIIRIFKASKRFFLFIYFLIIKHIDSILIFSSHGYSFFEKGLMAIIGKIFQKKVIFAPRSGGLLKQLNKKNNRFINFVFMKVDTVICQSEGWKNLFVSKFPAIDIEKFIIIKNWVNINVDFNDRDSNIGIINILFLGWVERAKGIFDLIEAAKILINNYPFLVFNIAGSGRDLEFAKIIISEAKLDQNFIFHGWVLGNDKINLLNGSDIFVLPSYYEGSPNALLEAMLYGLPCVVTNVGAVNEILIDGINGYIIEVGNIPMLADRIIQLTNSVELRKKFGNEAHHSILRNHNIDIAVEKFSRLLIPENLKSV